MDKNRFTLYYAPLRPYVNKFARRLGRFLYDWLPDVILIFVCVWLFMQLWEFCFWN